MASTALRATRNPVPFVGHSPVRRERVAVSPFVAGIQDAVRRCPATGASGKRHEVLYKSTNVATSLERLIDEEMRAGAAPVEVEAILAAIYMGGRMKLRGLIQIDDADLAAALDEEQEAENTCNRAELRAAARSRDVLALRTLLDCVRRERAAENRLEEVLVALIWKLEHAPR